MTLLYSGPTGQRFASNLRRDIERAVERGLDELALEGKTLFEQTTRTWETDVDFTVGDDGDLGKEIFTDNEIYGYVSNGTRPHTITARNGPALAFQIGHTAKTVPGALAARSGGRGGPLARPVTVQHPGIEAREFDEAVAERLERRAEQVVSAVLERALL